MMLPPIFTLLQASAAVRAVLGARPRVFHGSAPQVERTAQAGARPFVVWFVVAGVPQNTLGETPSHERVTVQLDVYATSDSEADDIGAAIRDQMEAASHMTDWRSSGQDAETRLYRRSLDFDYWLARES